VRVPRRLSSNFRALRQSTVTIQTGSSPDICKKSSPRRRSHTSLCHDFLPRNLAEHSEALLQPFRKCLPRAPASPRRPRTVLDRTNAQRQDPAAAIRSAHRQARQQWRAVLSPPTSGIRRVAAYQTLPCSPKVGKKFAKLTLHGTRCQFFVAPVAVTSRMRSSSLFLGRAAQPSRLSQIFSFKKIPRSLIVAHRERNVWS
jgi:hypothetical protein